MAEYPGSDMTQLGRFWETAAALVRAAIRSDRATLATCRTQLNNIIEGWILSAELAFLQEQEKHQRKRIDPGSATEGLSAAHARKLADEDPNRKGD